MSFPYKKLEDARVDVAGAVNEKFLNAFAASHHKHVKDIYNGEVLITSFDSDLRLKYLIEKPLLFDLTPIPSGKFKGIWKSHYEGSKKSLSADTFFDAFTPPNLKLTNDAFRLTITVYKGHTPDEDFSLEFLWALDARCAVLFKEYAPDKKAIRLEPIKVQFTKKTKEIEEEIRAALMLVLEGRNALSSHGKAADDEWCIKLEKLILFFVNQLLAMQVANFIREFELPRAIELAKGLSIAPSLLSIDENYLIVGGEVVYASPLVGELQIQTTQLVTEFSEQFRKEFSRMPDSEFEKWTPKTSSTVRWLADKEQGLREEIDAELKASTKLVTAYDQNVLIISNGELFDGLAKANLRAHESWSDSKKLDHLVKAEAGWWFDVNGSSAEVIAGGIRVKTNVDLGGYLRGCLPDPDPKHWGDWVCRGFCLRLKTKDFGLEAIPTFQGDGLYFRFKLTNNARIEVDFCDMPDWLRKLLAWLTSIFTEQLLRVISAIIMLFKFRVLEYPTHFPGTGLDWTPRFNNRMANERSYLVISGDPSFN